MQRSGNSMKRTVVFGAAGAALLVIGCGGGSGQCGGDVSCGGNVIGTWDITSTCTSGGGSTASSQTCSAENIDASKLKETGSIAFNADGTYSVTFTVSGSLDETVSATCLSSGTTSITCDEFSSLIQTAIQSGGDDPFSSVSCHGTSASCACSFDYATMTMTESGTYTTSGSTITTTPTTGTPETQSYCVQGSTMTVASSAMANMMDGMSTMTGVDNLRVQLMLKKR